MFIWCTGILSHTIYITAKCILNCNHDAVNVFVIALFMIFLRDFMGKSQCSLFDMLRMLYIYIKVLTFLLSLILEKINNKTYFVYPVTLCLKICK